MKNLSDRTIKATKGANYLSDVMDFIPSNILLSKQVTGCGATTLEITCNRNSIIAVPYTSLILNKVSQTPNLLGVYAGVSAQDVADYISVQVAKGEKIKVMTTYDSVEKVVKGFELANLDATKDAFLLVDEYHCLRTQYSFRSQAILCLLETVKSFDSVSFVTATPIDREFTLEALSEFPIVTMEWENVQPIVVDRVTTNSPKTAVYDLIVNTIDNATLPNLYFFINSVDFAKEILKTLVSTGVEISPANTGIFCADSAKNQLKYEDMTFNIEQETTGGKRINFLTSKNFEGVDIYDENGKTVIVSDNTKTNTLIEIGTAVKQIAGRIRDAKDKSITHIFNYRLGNRYYKSKEEFDKEVAESSKIDREVAAMVENLNGSVEAVSKLAKGALTTTVYLNENAKGVLFFDKELVTQDCYNWNILNKYQTFIRLNEEYTKQGFSLQVSDKLFYNATDKILTGTARMTFKDLVILLNDTNVIKRTIELARGSERLDAIHEYNDLVIPAYKALGYDRIEELNFDSQAVRRELDKVGIKEDDKTGDAVRAAFLTGVQYENKEAKEMLQKVYFSLGLKTKAQVKHLNEWFTIEQKSTRINGVKKRVIILS